MGGRGEEQLSSTPAGAEPAGHAPRGGALGDNSPHPDLNSSLEPPRMTHSLIGGILEQLALSQSEEASPMVTLLLGSLWEVLVWLHSTSCKPD